MKGISAVLTPSVQVADLLTEDALDELQAALVPAHADELPQGVLDLVATLILRQRATQGAGHALAWHSMVGSGGTENVEQGETRSSAAVGVSYPAANPQRVFPALPQPIPSAVILESTWSESSSNKVEPPPVERVVSSSAPSAPTVDMHLPEASLSFQTAPPAPRVAQPRVPSLAMQPPPPALDVMPETLPGPERGLLQVPFNSGAASGQVTISRMPDEPARNLLLSPSNTLVFEQLKSALELTREPGWQLTDDGGEQQGRGSHQATDEEQADEQGLPA